MADVQVEHGFTRIADGLLEALIRCPVPGRHMRVIQAVIRLTYGYGKARDVIALSQIAELTGIERRDLWRVVSDLVEWGMLGKRARGPRRAAEMWVVKDFDIWSPPVGSGTDRSVGVQPATVSHPSVGAQADSAVGVQADRSVGVQPALHRERDRRERGTAPP